MGRACNLEVTLPAFLAFVLTSLGEAGRVLTVYTIL